MAAIAGRMINMTRKISEAPVEPIGHRIMHAIREKQKGACYGWSAPGVLSSVRIMIASPAAGEALDGSASAKTPPER
ncbi:hypothetical protein [Palleronia abyssalis]|nr:hypothetical protein [Palleronia abyssalis]